MSERMTDERYAWLDHWSEEYELTADEMGELFEECERARASEAALLARVEELEESLANYEEYGHNLIKEKERFERCATSLIDAEAIFRRRETELGATVHELEETVNRLEEERDDAKIAKQSAEKRTNELIEGRDAVKQALHLEDDCDFADCIGAIEKHRAEYAARVDDVLAETRLRLAAEKRCEGLMAALRSVETDIGEYFRFHGAEHEEEDCPEDDGCECPLVQGVNRGFATLIRVQREFSEFVRSPSAAREGL